MRKRQNRIVSGHIKGYAALAAVTAVILPFTMTGCKQPVTADVTASVESGANSAGEINLAEDTLSAEGSAEQMIESGRHLYFKYGSTIWGLDRQTEKLEPLKTFEDSESNAVFWVYKGNLYFDTNKPMEDSAKFYGLYRLDMTTGEETHLTDLEGPAMSIYASEDILYVRSYNMSQAYQMEDNGDLVRSASGEVQEAEYGEIPEGCRELYKGIRPYYIEKFGYFPVQNDTCLVIADQDGKNGKEVPEVTNTSSVLFGKDVFFALFPDGSGNTECYRFDTATLEKKKLFDSSENPQLIQYRDGYLYYMTNNAYQTAELGKKFYRVDVKDGTVTVAAEMKTEPGTAGMYSYYGNFFVSDDAVYSQRIRGYGIYIGKTGLSFGVEETLIEPALYQSSIIELGHVEAEKKTIPCDCGERTATEVYVEKMVFDGDSEAAKNMNRIMEEKQKETLEYAEKMAGVSDEQWIHDDNYITAALSYEIAGINYLDERYVCIEADGYEYSGGAHGMLFCDYYVFDRQTGERLGLKDIVNNSQEELQTMVGSAFRKKAEETNFSFESPEDLEHTVSDDVSYDSEFYLTQEGVVFYYPPYEIASYAEGFPEITIPYSDLNMKIQLQ